MPQPYRSVPDWGGTKVTVTGTSSGKATFTLVPGTTSSVAHVLSVRRVTTSVTGVEAWTRTGDG